MRRPLLLAFAALAFVRCSSGSSSDSGTDAGGSNDAMARDVGGGDGGSMDRTISMDPCTGVKETCFSFTSDVSTADQIAEAFVTATPHTTLAFGPGTYSGF